jgi:hypothetical protein
MREAVIADTQTFVDIRCNSLIDWAERIAGDSE